MKTLILLLTLTLFSSCLVQKQKEVMNSWLNRHKGELIGSWGPPLRSVPDGYGGEILIYANRYVYYATTYWSYKMFYANKDGKIYRWMTKTETVPPMQIVVY